MSPPRASNRLALVSTPWPLYNRPSIQIGALKAYLTERFPDLAVQTYHLYLGIAAELGYRSMVNCLNACGWPSLFMQGC